MQMRPDELDVHLEKGLAAIYLISGDEPLQIMEAADAIRARARSLGHSEREVFSVEPGFDWGALELAADSPSLFAERRLLELRMPSGKPGSRGARVLEAYAERPAHDTVLLIESGKTEKTPSWARALERAGAWVQVWPLNAAETVRWIAKRLRSRGLTPSGSAVQLIAERVEGNLLAASQEVDKLSLLHGTGPLNERDVLASVADSARYSVFDLAQAALAGEAVRTLCVLQGLRGEGVDPVLILWALAREARSLTAMAEQLEAGAAPQEVLKTVWPRTRQPLIRQALRRSSREAWEELLRRCARVDRVIKGQAKGNTWDELLQLALGLGGRPLL